MNALLLSGLFLGMLGASPERMSYSDPGIGQTYDCCATCDSCDTCDDCCDDCEPCGRVCGRGGCCGRTACGPLTFVFSIFKASTWRGPSCGERYWGDFYSDPPECHDPCDTCGGYVGRASSGGDWGEVQGYASPVRSGCKNCGQKVYDDQPIPQQGRVISSSTRVSRLPTSTRPAAKPVRME